MNKNFFPEPNSDREQSNSQFNSHRKKESVIDREQKTNSNTVITAVLAITMVTLPVLSVGIVNYYFDSRSSDKQEIQTSQSDDTDSVEITPEQRQQMLAIVLIGTGTTALLASTLSAFYTLRIAHQSSEAKARQKREQQQQLFQEFIQYLSQSSDPEEILEVTVEEAQKLLECDRVLVYSLNQNSYGKIIAEAVIPGWKRALGKIIEDLCFESQYLDKYSDGHFRALNDIYEANLPPSHLEQLEKLEVKASLITPIFSEDKLFGLLVAHQCSEPHTWQDEEKEFLSGLAKRVSFALDNSKLLANQRHLLKQAEIEAQWTQLFTKTVGHIRQSLQQKDILNVTVEEVRRALNCDRVVVYSLNQDNYGVIISESVARGWMRALGKIIEDYCFAAKYAEKYSNGRVKAIDNIYEAEVTECYREQLEKLAVKAHLVTPILHNEKLFGLLIAHQCSQPRNWQQDEIRWVTQIATQVGFALDNAKLLADQRDLLKQAQIEAQWKQWYNDTVEHIHQSVNQKDVFNITVEKVRRILNCDRVVIYSLNQDNYGAVIAESLAPGWTRALGKIIEDPCFAGRYAEKYNKGRVKALDNIYTAEITPCYLEQLEKLEVKANLSVPIFYSDKLFGLLIAHQCSEPRSWQQDEIHWVKQISTQVGFALDNARVLGKLQIKEATKPHQALSGQIASAKKNQTDFQKDIAIVQETLAEATKKVKQLNQSSQKLLEMRNLIEYKFDSRKLTGAGEETEFRIENSGEE